MEVSKMTYNQYLNLMFSLECLYDHHPEFFKELPADEQAALSKMFLYDYDDYHDDDSDYPASVADYYRDTIEPDHALVDKAFQALENLYSHNGFGHFDISEVSDKR